MSIARVIRGSGIAAVVLMVAWAGTAAADPKWDAVLESAKKEGKVVVMTDDSPAWQPVMDAFRKAYPQIALEHGPVNPAEIAQRILSEQRAGVFKNDLEVTLSSNQVNILGPAGALQPMDDFFSHPDVIDDSKWANGKFELWGQEITKQSLTLIYSGTLSGSYAVNRDCVSEAELGDDDLDGLMNPKWKGKIVIDDLAVIRGGSLNMTPALRIKGEEWLRNFLIQQAPDVTGNQPLAQQWVITCRNPIAIGLAISAELRRQGLGGNVKENLGPLRIATSGISFLKNAPNPNAAKVFGNWFLTKEGQEVYVKAHGTLDRRGVTRRSDVAIITKDVAPDWTKYDSYTSPNTERDAALVQKVIAIYKSLK